jgi:hypothetical protein
MALSVLGFGVLKTQEIFDVKVSQDVDVVVDVDVFRGGEMEEVEYSDTTYGDRGHGGETFCVAVSMYML